MNQFFDALADLCRQTHEHFQGTVARTANMALAARLAERLQPLGRGFSGRSLRQFRAFYQQRKKIWQTVSAKLETKGLLGWSHYVELLTIDNPDERRFYEIEAAQNQWSVRELQRQIELAASSLEDGTP